MESNYGLKIIPENLPSHTRIIIALFASYQKSYFGLIHGPTVSLNSGIRLMYKFVIILYSSRIQLYPYLM